MVSASAGVGSPNIGLVGYLEAFSFRFFVTVVDYQPNGMFSACRSELDFFEVIDYLVILVVVELVAIIIIIIKLIIRVVIEPIEECVIVVHDDDVLGVGADCGVDI
jgi:hypothetical protein